MTDNFIKPENFDAVMAESKQWLEEVKHRDDDEQYAYACEIGGQILDINIWDGSKISDDNMWHCEAIECFDENNFHTRGYRYQHLWSVTKEEVVYD